MIVLMEVLKDRVIVERGESDTMERVAGGELSLPVPGQFTLDSLELLKTVGTGGKTVTRHSYCHTLMNYIYILTVTKIE